MFRIHRVIVANVCAILVLASAAAPAGAQANRDSAKHELALQLIARTKVADMIVAGMEASIPGQRASTPQLPAEFWDLFLAKAKAGADSLARMLAPVYVEAFSEEDLRALVVFYETPLGQRLVQSQPLIFARSTEIGQRWGTALGLSVAQELQARVPPPR
jgi:hypothetical protein